MNSVIIKIPSNLVLPTKPFSALALTALLLGAKTSANKEMSIFENIDNSIHTYSLFGYDAVASVIQSGGEVLNYKSFIKVNLQDKVPSYIRNSETKGFEGGNITKQKWIDWIHPNAAKIEIDGDIWISGYSHYAGFKTSESIDKHLTGTEMSSLIKDNYTIMNSVDFLALQNNKKV